MTHPATSALAHLRRPRLLIRAARFGLSDYDRTRCLRRILPDACAKTQANPLSPLIEQEAQYEARRAAGDAGYMVARHVEILIALISEAQRVLRPSAPV
ncbi:DUF6477 family protein [Oceaniglobus ichthyenteri]|uniref:DUF6477 family protein n=1 Tax=Oceaniglobus ichthyenteri TaxID=2136177 RepID=UPI000D35EE22|nr:DUF6477 family protein [Oceaniglobus ichthyenteri]